MVSGWGPALLSSLYALPAIPNLLGPQPEPGGLPTKPGVQPTRPAWHAGKECEETDLSSFLISTGSALNQTVPADSGKKIREISNEYSRQTQSCSGPSLGSPVVGELQDGRTAGPRRIGKSPEGRGRGDFEGPQRARLLLLPSLCTCCTPAQVSSTTLSSSQTHSHLLFRTWPLPGSLPSAPHAGLFVLSLCIYHTLSVY